MENANNTVFGAVTLALLGTTVTPVLAARGVTYTMGKTNYREVDDGTDSREPTEAREVRVAAPRAARVQGAPTKADQVREMIAEAKACHSDLLVVIARVVAELGMARGQASKYVNENWSRV